MTEHVIASIILFFVPVVLFGLLYTGRKFLIQQETSFGTVMEWINPAFLLALSILISVPMIADLVQSFIFAEFLFILMIAAAVVGVIQLFSDIYNRSEEQNYRNMIIWIGVFFVLFLLISGLDPEFFFGIFGAIATFILSIMISITIIATGIAVYPSIANYFSKKQIEEDKFINEGDEITVFTNKIVSGKVESITRDYVIITEGENMQYHLQPRKILEVGYQISTKVNSESD